MATGSTAPVLSGDPFLSFGTTHIFTAAIVIAVAVGLPLAVNRWAAPQQVNRLKTMLAVLLILQIVVSIWVRVGVYGEPLKDNLPLHLCGASLILSAIVLLFGSYRAYEVAYFWALSGGLPAVLMPDVEYAAPHPFFFLFFTGHGLELMAVAFATFVLGFRPTAGSIVRVLAITAGYAVLIFPLNFLLGSNYLYLRHKPTNPSIIDLMGPWPWYIIGLAALAIVLVVLTYLPFAFLPKKDRRLKTD